MSNRVSRARPIISNGPNGVFYPGFGVAMYEEFCVDRVDVMHGQPSNLGLSDDRWIVFTGSTISQIGYLWTEKNIKGLRVLALTL